jgi:uncharacterized membrane protein (Fun14 family)
MAAPAALLGMNAFLRAFCWTMAVLWGLMGIGAIVRAVAGWAEHPMLEVITGVICLLVAWMAARWSPPRET